MKRKAVHATLTDVARKARVGTSTVSRVINGGRRVSPETLARVRAVIEKLDYRPNHAARILKGDRTKTIGLIVPSVADPFFANCAEAAQEICRSHNFLLTVACSNNDPRIEMENLNILLQHRVDGLLLAPAASHNRELVRVLHRASIPVVSIDRPIHDSGVPRVVSNNYLGAKEATRHLIAHGYKRITLMGMKSDHLLYTNQERIRGYRHAMQEANLTPQVDVSMTNYESAERVLKTHLFGATPPNAIFAIRNLVAIYSVEAFRKLNIKVPATVALLGFDDFELAATLEPSVTVIKQQETLMGKIAAEMLFEQIMLKRRHKLGSTNRTRHSGIRRLDTELILRSSCGCAKPIAAMQTGQ